MGELPSLLCINSFMERGGLGWSGDTDLDFKRPVFAVLVISLLDFESSLRLVF